VSVVTDIDGPPLPNIKAISAGAWHVLALDEDGSVWAWGSTNFGQLGTGVYQTDPWIEKYEESPVKVKKTDGTDLSDIIYIDAGYEFSCAIDRYGNFWTWGNNGEGQLGIGTWGDLKTYATKMDIVSQSNEKSSAAVKISVGEQDAGHTYFASDASVWYSYTAQTSAYISISLSGSNFDTMLTLWDGQAENRLAANNDLGGLQSNLIWYAEQGNTYLIEVASGNGERGNYVLSIDYAGVPSNDDCSDAIAVNAGQQYNGSTILASEGSVWYSYEPDSNGMATVSLCGSSFDTKLALYDACGGSVLDDDDDDCPGLQSQLTYNMTAYTTYLIKVCGSSNDDKGNYVLEVTD
jgi:hypothetical protein